MQPYLRINSLYVSAPLALVTTVKGLYCSGYNHAQHVTLPTASVTCFAVCNYFGLE